MFPMSAPNAKGLTEMRVRNERIFLEKFCELEFQVVLIGANILQFSKEK